MIELSMVRRMAVRAALLSPVLLVALAAIGGWDYAWSGAIGLALMLANLWLSARIIGGVAERSPGLLMPVALATFALGLLLLTGVALGLQALDAVVFPVTGFVLVGSHLLLVLWEAGGAYARADARAATSGSEGPVRAGTTSDAVDTRS